MHSFIVLITSLTEKIKSFPENATKCHHLIDAVYIETQNGHFYESRVGVLSFQVHESISQLYPMPTKLRWVHWFHFVRPFVRLSVDQIVSVMYIPQH